jgi:cell division GTPase FtsZ
VNVLLLSSGGGGGNILRSLKAMFRRDLLVTQKADSKYAERLRRAVTTRFLDTNEFSLSDVPEEERLVVGAATTRRIGSRHNPELARQAFDESKEEVEAAMRGHSVVIIIATGGKGTGAGTIFPLAEMARRQKKLVIPIFVRPSFERHEVEKRRYDHALKVTEQFDAAGIRLIEVLNDRGYSDSAPEPQTLVWERMNLPIARGLRGLLYVLWDLSQVDPSDLSILFAGDGRLRVGFSEIDPPDGQEPSDAQIEKAVRGCWDNPYYAFREPVGTSLVCIQGDWSNVVDGKIKGRLAALALSGAADNPYNPLYARAIHAPRPWGVTALFAEHTGTHAALEIEWSAERRPAPRATVHADLSDVHTLAAASEARPQVSGPKPEAPGPKPRISVESHPFPTFWEFALALNRLDPTALKLAGHGADSAIRIDPVELRKLLGTFWFRSVFPRLSQEWRDRLFQVLLENVVFQDHVLKSGRRPVRISELSHDRLRQIAGDAILPDAVRSDLHLMIAVGAFWGPEALKRFTFRPAPDAGGSSRMPSLLQPFRH